MRQVKIILIGITFPIWCLPAFIYVVGLERRRQFKRWKS